jgi:hypothetical protein
MNNSLQKTKLSKEAYRSILLLLFFTIAAGNLVCFLERQLIIYNSNKVIDDSAKIIYKCERGSGRDTAKIAT